MKVSSKKFKPEYVVPHNIVRSNEKGAAEYEVKKVLDSLTAERQHWETNVYKTSIEALYALLQKCYSFECQLRNNVEGASDRRKALNEYTRNLGFSFKSDTPLINRVVRCVFGDIQRSRVSNYAKVLRRAKQDSVEPEDIPNYITENGGIDAIRLKASPTYKSSAVKAGLVKDAAKETVLAVAKSDALSLELDVNNLERQVVLLATPQPSGSYAINAVIRSQAALTAALASYYSQSLVQVTNAKLKHEAANDSDIQAAAVNAIVNA